MKKLADCMVPALGHIVRDSDRYRQLIARSLPAEMAEQVLFVRVIQGRARVTVASSAFAAKLRFFQREIQEQISSVNPVSQLSVHVLPAGTSLTELRTSVRDKPTASPSTVNAIEQTARAIGDTDLQKSLQRLARNLDKHKEK
ncbi:MAG: hypothetical protein KTR33_13055 [Gammaproteobacteria bacterium]|nr:hypothetical protein [Gammaproteobacteria bacterium]